MKASNILQSLKNFLNKDHVIPFLLMVNGIVYCLMLFSIGTTEAYFLCFAAVAGSVFIQYTLHKDFSTIDNLSYTVIGIRMILLGLLIQRAISGTWLRIEGWGNMMLILGIILSMCALLAYSYLAFLRNKQKEDTITELGATKDTITREGVSFGIFFLHRKLVAIVVICVLLLGIFFYIDKLSLFSMIWWLTVVAIVIFFKDHRYFAFGALLCLLVTIAFLLIPHEPYANIAATYCYYYLCATVVYALFTPNENKSGN